MEGTVKPAPNFNPDRDCEVLRKAMKGLGTDEKAIIDVLAHRSNEQRLQLKLKFKVMYGKDLIKELKSELGGNFENCVMALMLSPAEFDASECRRAISGAGTDESDLIEIMCTRTNKQIMDLKAAYKLLYKRDLEKDLMGETSGHFKRLMVSLSVGGRDEGTGVDPARVKQDAQTLYQAGEAKWGTDESEFNKVLCSRSYLHLRAVFAEYQNLSKKSLEQAIKSEFSGYIEKGMLSIVRCVNSPSAYFAERAHSTMASAGTRDKDLIRVIVSRCEVDMVQIKQEYQRLYGKSLDAMIRSDTSGDYKNILVALVSQGGY